MMMAGSSHHPFSFRSGRKENGPWTVQKKRALFLDPVSLDHSTGLFSAFAVTSRPPAPCPAPSASLGATRAVVGAGSRRSGRQHQEAAQVARAAKSGASAGAALSGWRRRGSSPTTRRPDAPGFPHGSPRKNPGVLRGRRPLFPAGGEGTSRTLPPERPFAYFSHGGKVGRAGARNAPPPRGGHPVLSASPGGKKRSPAGPHVQDVGQHMDQDRGPQVA